MKTKIILFISSLFLISCSIKKNIAVFVNPTKSLKVEFNLTANKTPFYKVFYENKVVIDSSHLGIIMEQANFYNDMSIIKISEPILVEDSYTCFKANKKILFIKPINT